MDLALNRRASVLADAMEEEAEKLRVAIHRLRDGTRIIDCGIHQEGSFEAGCRLAEICLGGAGKVSLTSIDLEGLWLPAVQVATDHPVAACLCSQYAGWRIDLEGYGAMGSGPARALARVERELFERIGYAESGPPGVLLLESRVLPGEPVASYVASRSGIPAGGLTLLVAPTASLAGSAQIAARGVETGLHKMLGLGFDVNKVRTGLSLCPMAPVAKNDLQALGWTNDCILYGARTYYAVEASDHEVEAMMDRLPASASPDYGTPFAQIFSRAGHDFYKIDPMLFSPAEITINNLATGRVFRAGRVDVKVLRAALGRG
jgi:methenyltetrahydromethanopterin cyclohydrolase